MILGEELEATAVVSSTRMLKDIEIRSPAKVVVTVVTVVTFNSEWSDFLLGVILRRLTPSRGDNVYA
jgi:hypothetical protein